MGLRQRLDAAIAPYALLSHPFYQAWNDGRLSRAALQHYAAQYYHHVLAFPTYLSSVHARCGEDVVSRRALLENLVEEERGDRNHAALWLDFAAGVGADAEAVASGQPGDGVRALVDCFRTLTAGAPATGAAALYAYESQIPAVAAAKIAGLRRFFAVEDEQTLAFFSVHRELDVYHSDTTAAIVDRLGGGDEAVQAAGTAAHALWKFLDSMPTA